MSMNFRQRSADASRFSMVPRADVPRSVFNAQQTHKTAFDAGYLIPVYVDEILPGDSVKLDMTAFARMATPLFPVMDNLHLDSFFFFVPNRLVWDNWQAFMGEGTNNDYTIPTRLMDTGGYAIGSIYDYFGLPTAGQIPGGGYEEVYHSVLPFRAYNLIWNEWFRDQVLQSEVTVNTGDAEGGTTYALLKRGKRHDYFTSCRPWPMRDTHMDTSDISELSGRFAVRGGAPVTGLGGFTLTGNTAAQTVYEAGGEVKSYTNYKNIYDSVELNKVAMRLDAAGFPDVRVTINAMREAFAVQRLLERDARGGTRYTEIVRSHFGVVSPDQRLQRPEYLGGGSSPIVIQPIAQTYQDSQLSDGRVVGELGAVASVVASRHGFSQSFTEHGFIIGLVAVRADLTYQQGIHRMWSRKTRFDHYWPAFAHLGEQPVYRREIYCTGDPANDDLVFGYQERWAEYRHKPNRISGKFRSTASGTLDAWHLAQKFTSAPTLGATFIQDAPPIDRIVAATNEPEFIFDSLFDVRMVRPIPAWSVPGLSDHF